MKKFAAIVLTLSLCLCAAAAQAFTLTGLETESVTREWETNLFFSRMEALTGIKTTPAAVYDTEEYAKKIAEMENGVMPADVLFKANLTREQEIALLDCGALVDLAPMIAENMPNLSAMLDANPVWRETITLEDGRIASLPQFNDNERMVCMWINKAWLDQLGLAMPETLDALGDVLKAFKYNDPNKNGKDDEIPLDMIGMFEMRWMLPYFSIVADDYHLMRDAQGEIVFAPEQPGYREFAAQLAQWYRMGYFGSGAFNSVHSADSLENTDDETVVSGVLLSIAPYTHVPVASATEYVPLLIAGPDGSIRWRNMLGEVWTGTFAVTSACEDPAQALRWADALYGEEGAILAYAGIEGEEYAFNEEGEWSFIADAIRSVDDIRAESIIYTGVTMPGMSPNEFLNKVDSDIDRYVIAANEQVAAVSELVTHAYLLGAADQARADEIALTLCRRVDEGLGRFITGETEMTDDNWNAWLETLRDAGSEELTELFRAADQAERRK